MLRPRFPADVPVERGFVPLPHGQVHYRAAGHGPVLLALHESPNSSLTLQTLMAGLARHYRVIAPDTPGYGLSDPLRQDEPAMADFAAALLQFLDAMGLGRVALYGTHTGAALATALAARCPGRVTALVLDGISAFSADEVAAFREHYLPCYVPAWDGRHVMQIWSRVKDAATWFPWYERRPDARLERQAPSAQSLHRAALGLVQAGRHYAKAYSVSAAFDPRPALADMPCPVTIMAREGDVLAGHLDRLGHGPWAIERLGRDRSAWTSAVLAGLKRGPRPDTAGVMPPAVRLGSQFLSIGCGWLHVRLDWRKTGFVRLLLPGLPGDSAALLRAQRRRHPKARLVAIDLPGCGWSDPLEDLSIENVLDVLDKAVARLAIEPRCIVGEGASAVIATLWAERHQCRVETVAEPPWLRDRASLAARPLLEAFHPKPDGSHMTGAWFRLRDMMLQDVPPQLGRITHGTMAEPPVLDRLQGQFRSYVEGPESAALLALVADMVRLWPEVMSVPQLKRTRSRSQPSRTEIGHADNG